MPKEETTKERLKGVETEIKGVRDLMQLLEKTSDQRHIEVVNRLDQIVSNGKEYARIPDMATAIATHANSCLSRANPGNGLKEGWVTLREGWKTLAGVVTLATGLSVILGKLLEKVGGG